MKKHKIQMSAKKKCQGNSVHFQNILEYAYDIKFEEKPDYAYLKFMLKKILLEMDHVPQKMFNWKSRSAYLIKYEISNECDMDNLFEEIK